MSTMKMQLSCRDMKFQRRLDKLGSTADLEGIPQSELKCTLHVIVTYAVEGDDNESHPLHLWHTGVENLRNKLKN